MATQGSCPGVRGPASGLRGRPPCTGVYRAERGKRGAGLKARLTQGRRARQSQSKGGSSWQVGQGQVLTPQSRACLLEQVQPEHRLPRAPGHISQAPPAPGPGALASQLGCPREGSANSTRWWVSAQAPRLPLQSVEGGAKAVGEARRAPWSSGCGSDGASGAAVWGTRGPSGLPLPSRLVF